MLALDQSQLTETWILSHSGHMVVHLQDGFLHLSGRLSKRQAISLAAELSESRSSAHNAEVSLDLSTVTEVVADNANRSIVIFTQESFVELQKWPSPQGAIGSALGRPDVHDPANPESPTSWAAATIAFAAGLLLKTDERAEILHYLESHAAEARYEHSRIEGGVSSIKLRPKFDVYRYGFFLGWTIALPILLDFFHPVVVVQGIFFMIGFLWQLVVLIRGVVVDDDGVRFGPGPSRKVPWANVDLLHVVSSTDDPLSHRLVELRTFDGKKILSPRLSRKQVELLAAALVIHGSSWSVYSSVFASDLGRRRKNRKQRIKSPISEFGL